MYISCIIYISYNNSIKYRAWKKVKKLSCLIKSVKLLWAIIYNMEDANSNQGPVTITRDGRTYECDIDQKWADIINGLETEEEMKEL